MAYREFSLHLEKAKIAGTKMRACFYSAASSLMSGLISSLIVLGLAGGSSAVMAQEPGVAPANRSAAPADTQAHPEPAQPSAQANDRAASDANINPAHRNRASAARTASTTDARCRRRITAARSGRPCGASPIPAI